MASTDSKNVNFIGLAEAFYADVQDPNRTDQPVGWKPLGQFLLDSTSFGRDDVSEFNVQVEESDDPIYTEYTQQPLKFTGDLPNLTDDAKIELGGYTRVVSGGVTTLQAPDQTPTVTKMVKFIPKSGKFEGMILYQMSINLNIGDALNKTSTLNDKISMTALKPREDQPWTNGSAYSFLRSSEALTDIIEFTTILPETSSVINAVAHEVNIVVPNGTVITAVKPFIRVNDGGSVSPASLAEQSFTSGSPVVYTVTAEDGTTTQAWDVTITVSA
jgi:hypothetical protein